LKQGPKEFTVILSYDDEPEHFGAVADSFIKSLKGLALMKVNLCEAYQCAFHDPDTEKEQLSLIVLQYELGNNVRYPYKAELKLDQIIPAKAKACNVSVLPRLGLDWLIQQWKENCYKVQRVRGMGNLYELFAKVNDAQHIVYDKIID
jgi:hypothetical protein